MAILKAITLPAYSGKMTKCCETATIVAVNMLTEERHTTCLCCGKDNPEMIEYTPERHGDSNTDKP